MSRIYKNNYGFLCSKTRKKAISYRKKDNKTLLILGRGKKNIMEIEDIKTTDFQLIMLENGKYITNDFRFFHYIKERGKHIKVEEIAEKILSMKPQNKDNGKELETLQYNYLRKVNSIDYKKIQKGNKKGEDKDKKIVQILRYC